MEIVVATRNRKKITEIGRMLEGLPVRLLALDDVAGCPEIEETGDTFEENALLKARGVARYCGRAALADDSGLEVYALGGAPGVYSARYAGVGSSDAENTAKLLAELSAVPDDRRGARFVCVVALASPDGTAVTFTGTVEGRVGREHAGRSGFGYDPVFYPEGHDKTFAEMSPSEKDSMSHRGRALEGLRAYLAGAGTV